MTDLEQTIAAHLDRESDVEYTCGQCFGRFRRLGQYPLVCYVDHGGLCCHYGQTLVAGPLDGAPREDGVE